LLMLRSKCQCSSSSASETRVETEGRDSTLGSRVFEELEVVQAAFALSETAEDGGPAGLLFVAMCELNVGMGQGVARSRQ